MRLEQHPDPAALARLLDEIEASRQKVAARAARLPQPTFPAELPVAREAEGIIDLLRRHQVLVVAGETGSGKTTQIPKMCLAAGRGAAGMIGCTQPRRIAARSVARRVAEELGVELGGLVGYQVRFTEQVGEDTAIKFMTDGILLAEIQSDRWLSRYDTLILDEAHERSLNIDFLLGYLKGLLCRRRDLKLVVTSATIDTERFARHFGNAPVVRVEGRSHPVEVRYRPPSGVEAVEDESGEVRREARSQAEHIVAVVDEITGEDPLGDILVFLPGEREIHDLHRLLERRRYRQTEVLPLYARLSARDQDRVFRPGPGRRIVLATNVAETSLTVPRIRYVIDPGTARVKRYSPRQKLDRLHVEPISRAAADQRKGRCGRTAAGVCYRLYEEADYLARPAYTDPEIRRSALAGVILRMLSLGLGRVDAFPFIDPPDPKAVSEGWQQLVELGAVDKDRRLTEVGRQMARWPVDVKLARMLIAARELGVLREVLVIASFLSIQDPRERPAEARAAADAAHARFADPRSEFVGILQLWQAAQNAFEALTRARFRQWCDEHYLNPARMREWRELHRQLLLLAAETGGSPGAAEADYGALHRALIAGMPMQIGQRIDKGLFEAPRQRRFAIFPGSALARQPPRWVLAAALLDTQRVFALHCARIEPKWVVEQAAHLLSRRHFDPHWSRAQGRVIGFEQISLFGLVLEPKRPVQWAGLYPQEAREIFVREGLVRGEVNTRLAFLERNLRTLERAREEEAKLRRAGLVADEDWQARWYLDRLPQEVHGVAGLESWYRRAGAAERAALEWSLADLMPGGGEASDRFPAYLVLGDARLALHYRFEPGSEEDGVTVDVPLHLLNALDAARLSWLVPGFVAERAAELIRGLPKALRRNYVPAPDFAQAFAEAHPQPTADSLEGELARFLSRTTGVRLAPSELRPESLPAHLRMRVRLLDAGGRPLAVSRDLAELKACHGRQADAAFAARTARGLACPRLEGFPEQGVPEQIEGEAGIPAYPALVDLGDGVALAIRADRAQAAREHPLGVQRLLRLDLQPAMKQVRRQLPVRPQVGLLYAVIESEQRLREDLVEAAFLALCERPLGAVRDPATYQALREEVRRGLFAEAMERLRLAERILELHAALRPALQPPLVGFARANYEDLEAQLAGLVYPGFLRHTPAERLCHLPRYLRGMQLRAERIARDPLRDQARMLELGPFLEALARHPEERRTPAWHALRWALEELRISLFAQELGTPEPVSAKRLVRLLEALEATSAA